MIPGIVLENLLGRHSGPGIRPLLPVASATLSAIAAAGYRFVQFGPMVRTTPDTCRRHGLRSVAAITWHLAPGDRDLDRSLGRAADRGFDLASVLVGTGLCGRDEAARRVESLLRGAESRGLDVCLETHRATITESFNQTLWLAERFGSLRFNLDLSHWFVTHRLDRVDVGHFVAMARPVLSRCRLVHGRVAAPDEIQAPVDEAEHAPFFRAVWSDVAAHDGDAWFAPELLPSWMGYGRDDRRIDRWADADTLRSWVVDG